MEIRSEVNLVNDPEKLLQVEGSLTILATTSLGKQQKFPNSIECPVNI